MGARYLTDMADVLRAVGLVVIEVDGWGTRARNSGGFEGNRPWCVMWHHTASQTSPENDVTYIVYGSPDSPLANLYLDRDGAVWVCAAGATNTNGKGDAQTMSLGTVPADSMNTHGIGIEAANSGVGEVWPQAQVDAYFRINNALAAAYGLRPDDCRSHAAYAPGRKIDPATADAVQGPWRPRSINTAGTWSLEDIHDEAWLRSNEPTPTPTPPPEDDDMNAATIWRHQAYSNTFLIGAGSTMQIAPATQASLIQRGVPVVAEWDDHMLEVCLHQTGQTTDDLVPV